MLTGKYWGSAEHRADIAAVQKDTLHFIKEMTEEYLLTRRDTTKQIIDSSYAFYKRLKDYKY
jgi:hypothetical protein